MLVAFSIGCIAATGTLLPSVLKSQTLLTTLPVLFFPLMPLTITYAIIKHRLWDIRTVVHKTTAWLILSAGLLIPIYFLFRLGAPLIKKLGGADIALLITVLFILGYGYVRILKPRVDHLFQRRAYDRRKALDRLAKEMNSLRNTNDVIDQILETVHVTLYPEKVSILLRSEAFEKAVEEAQKIGTQWKKFGLTKGEPSRGIASVVPEDPVVRRIMDLASAVEISQLDMDSRFDDIKEEAQNYFKACKIQVCYPLLNGDSLLGLIHLSEKTNLKAYSRDDLEFLEHLGSSASVGLANSLLFDKVDRQRQTVEELAAGLEAKVKERTKELRETNIALEKANAALRDLDRFKSQFFANISHELRTPLTLILGPAGNLLSGALGPLDKKQTESIHGIEKSAMELLKLINDLLDLSRLEEARLKIKLAKMDIKEMLVKIIEFARPLAVQKNIDIALEADGDLSIIADADKLERVFVNILSNALKFSHDGKSIWIKAKKDGANFVVSVEDQGIGIPQEYLEKIFDRFGQVDSSITKQYGGSGIGLALARELVQLHRGAVTVESDVGYGSTFTVTLPENIPDLVPEELRENRTEKDHASTFRSDSDAGMLHWGGSILASPEYRFMEIERIAKVGRDKTGEPLKEARSKMFKSARILVADDNVDILNYLRNSLSDRYEVWTATDGEQAWNLLLEQRHDLLIADVMMPKLSGLDLCKTIKKDSRTQDVPVILLTALGSTQHRVEGHSAGADQYFGKPFDMGELRVAVRNLLAGRTRRFEVGARRHSASLETLLGGMAHELHNAAQSLQGAQTAMWTIARRTAENKGKPDSKPPHEAVKSIDRMQSISERALARISAVVNSLKQYTRNQMQMPWEDLNIDDLVAREVRLLTAGEEKGVEINLLLNSGLAVHAPEEELRQMILNLVENAIHAVDSGGKVEVKTTAGAGKVILVVKDNGCGIPPENRKRIFDPFFTTKQSGKGIGLGLALCKRTITDLGGHIEVRSEVGKGTEMIVELPCADFKSTAPPASFLSLV